MIRTACLVFLLGQISAIAQSTIAHFSGNPFFIPFSDSHRMDFDGDGNAEVVFENGGFLCTTDVPTSACSTYYKVGPEEGSAILVLGNSFGVLAEGDQIGSSPAGGAWWDASWFGRTILGYTVNMIDSTADIRLTGALADVDGGYLGIAFAGVKGIHYGWIRVEAEAKNRLMNSPRVVEWAYETRTGKPIKAGAKPSSVAVSLVESSREGYLRIRWESEPAKAYQVQSKAALTDHTWTNLGFLVIGTTTNTIVQVPTTGQISFYRVVEAD